MELRDLYYFLTIVREGSLTAAAKVLHLSQPGITRSLKLLEDELGKQLIIRGSRRVVLTAEGMTLVGYPTEDGTGAFLNAAYNRWGIVRNTSPEKQAGAWAFLRTLAAEEAQQIRLPGEDGAQEEGVFYGENGFPINKAAAEHYAERLIAKDEQNVPNPQTAQGVAYDAGWLSREEYDRCMAYIQGINRLSTNIDSSLQAIVEEELRRMYADEQTPEETAEKIQSRASIMVSERS